MKKKKFYIYQEDLIRYEVEQELLTISQFVDNLNKRYCTENMKKLRTDSITNYLCTKGYLILNNEKRKMPTRKGKILGIELGTITDKEGKRHIVNLYNARAKQYILDNLYEII